MELVHPQRSTLRSLGSASDLAHADTNNLENNKARARATMCTYVRFDAGRQIFANGDTFYGIYIVTAGAAKVTVPGEDDELIVGLSMPGDVLGLGGIDELRHNSSAVAVSELLLIWVPREVLSKYCKKYTDFKDAILHAFSQQIFDATIFVEVLAGSNCTEKIAFFLVFLAVRFGTYAKPSLELNLTLNRKGIATFLGFRYETFSRKLCEFQGLGILRAEGDWVYLNDIDTLKKISLPYSSYLSER
jgi:CRP/FNR family transcriptional regulator